MMETKERHNETTKRFHVVLLPKQETREKLVQFSQDLDCKNASQIVLGDKALPHITLYAPEIPKENFDSACEALERVTKKVDLQNLSQNKVDKAPGGDGGVFAFYKESADLSVLRDLVIGVINPMRDGIIRNKFLYRQEDDEIQKYGYPISEYHFPHVTLAKYNDPRAREEMVGKRECFTEDFIPRSVAVVETGEHGTARNVIKEFLLTRESDLL